MSYMLKITRRFMDKFRVSRKSLTNDVNQPKRADTKWKARKAVFNAAGYNRYGLYSDDVVNEDNHVVREALRRLPIDVLDARNFRIIRAIHLNFLKVHLPKEKWISYEQDVNYRYLCPYMREIEDEKREIFEFGCTNYDDDDWPAGEVK